MARGVLKSLYESCLSLRRTRLLDYKLFLPINHHLLRRVLIEVTYFERNYHLCFPTLVVNQDQLPSSPQLVISYH